MNSMKIIVVLASFSFMITACGRSSSSNGAPQLQTQENPNGMQYADPNANQGLYNDAYNIGYQQMGGGTQPTYWGSQPGAQGYTHNLPQLSGVPAVAGAAPGGYTVGQGGYCGCGGSTVPYSYGGAIVCGEQVNYQAAGYGKDQVISFGINFTNDENKGHKHKGGKGHGRNGNRGDRRDDYYAGGPRNNGNNNGNGQWGSQNGNGSQYAGNGGNGYVNNGGNNGGFQFPPQGGVVNIIGDNNPFGTTDWRNVGNGGPGGNVNQPGNNRGNDQSYTGGNRGQGQGNGQGQRARNNRQRCQGQNCGRNMSDSYASDVFFRYDMIESQHNHVALNSPYGGTCHNQVMAGCDPRIPQGCGWFTDSWGQPMQAVCVPVAGTGYGQCMRASL